MENYSGRFSYAGKYAKDDKKRPAGTTPTGLQCRCRHNRMYSGCLPQPPDCLVEMRRIELLSESIVSPTSPSAATDYF